MAAALAVSALAHVALLGVGSWEHVRGPEAAEPLEPRRFVKRLPPSRRPLARRQVDLGPQRPMARVAAARPSPRSAVAPAPLTTQRRGLQGTPVPLVVGAPPPVDLPVLPMATFDAAHIGPQLRSGAVTGTRTGARDVDLSVEMLGVDAMDTGRHRALVVVDPRDRRGLKGYLHLTRVTSDNLERAEIGSAHPRRANHTARHVAETQALRGLAQWMNAETGVHTDILDALRLDDPRLLSVPFLLLTVNDPFQFTRAEARNLGQYLTGGGFAFFEVTCPPRSQGNGYETDLPELRNLIRASLSAAGCREGPDWRFARLPAEHPLYHCFFDIGSLPKGFWVVAQGTHAAYGFYGMKDVWAPPYLEAVEVHGAIAGLYSRHDFCDYWGGTCERIEEGSEWAGLFARTDHGAAATPVYRLGVNVLVYALTREGSLAQQFVAAE